MSSNLFDKRSAFFKSFFEKALPYKQYLETGSSTQQQRWHAYNEAIELTESQKNALKTFKRKLNILMMSGIWCGDCMRQGPMINRLAEATSTVDLRYIDNQAHPELRDELRIAGGERVPVVVALTEDFFEVGRFGDRTLSHYRGKAARELGEACDSGLLSLENAELQAEVAEWFEFIERSHLIARLSPFLRQRYRD